VRGLGLTAWAITRPIWSISSYDISIWYILILFSHQRLELLSALFRTRISNQNFVHISHLLHVVFMSRQPHPPWFDNFNTIWWKVKFI
jgi:hypothetical protein